MIRRHPMLFSCLLLLLALLAWCGVVVFALAIKQEDAAYIASLQNTQISSQKTANTDAAHALAAQIAPEASALGVLLQVDPVAFAKTITAVGESAGSSVDISGAVPESAPTTVAPPGLALSAFGFTVEAAGSFNSLIRTVQLLETLPAPSSIQEIDFEHTPSSSQTPGGSSAAWHMNAQVRVLTTANISS